MNKKSIAATIAVVATALVAIALTRPAYASPHKQDKPDPYLLASGPIVVSPTKQGAAPLQSRFSFVLPAVQRQIGPKGHEARLLIMDGDCNMLLPAVQLGPEDGEDMAVHSHYFAAWVTAGLRNEQTLRILDENNRKIIYAGPLPKHNHLHLIFVGAQTEEGRNFGPVGSSIALFGDGSVRPGNVSAGDGSVRPVALKSFDPVDPSTTNIIAVLIGL